MPRLIQKRPPPQPELEPDLAAWPKPAARPPEHTRLRVKERFSYEGTAFEAGTVLSGHDPTALAIWREFPRFFEVLI